MEGPVDLIKKRPAETAAPITTVLAGLIAKLAGVEDTDTILYLALVLSFVPAAVTWLVELLKKQEETVRSTKATVDKLDYTFPTLVRYVGLLTTLVLIGFSLAGYAVQAAPGFVAAGGMLLYKTVHDAAKSSDREEEL